MSQSPTPHKTEQHSRQLIEVLSLLHLALKNIQLYPPGHNLLRNQLNAAHQALTRTLAAQNRLTFGVARDTFTHAEAPIGENSAACSAFARILTSHEIASITFSKGITQHALFLFLKTVGILPEQQTTGENILQQISSLNIPNLQIELVDYSYFAKHRPGDSESSPLSWMTFTQKLTSGTLGHHPGGHAIAGSKPDTTTPKALAATINQQIGDRPQILQQFSSLLDQLLQQKSVSSFGGKEISQTLSSLSPKLRKQFLNTTLEQCDKNIQTGNTEKILHTFSDSVVLDMLQQINKEHTTVSPALLNLIHKLSTIRFQAEGQTAASSARGQQGTNLLQADSSTQQVSPEYQHHLQQLAKHSSPATAAPPDFPLDTHLQSMEGTQLNRKIVLATLMVMEPPSPDKEYKALAHKLMTLALQLPDDGAFTLLQTIVKRLRQQALNKKTTVQQAIAKKCIVDLAAPDFLDYILSILPDATEKQKQDAVDFLLLLGHATIDSLLKIYCIKTNVSAQDPILTVLKTFRVQTLTQVFSQISNTTPANVLKLLQLVDSLGTRGIERLLHPWLTHENSNIRDQTMHLLLPVNDQQAINTVISMLESRDELAINTALQFCDTHRSRVYVPALLKLLDDSFITHAAIERNRRLIEVLGHIGDPRALVPLEKIAFTGRLFQRKEVANMKRLIFYSLKDYRMEDRKRLLLKGKKTKDKQIVTICSTLLHAHQSKGTEK